MSDSAREVPTTAADAALIDPSTYPRKVLFVAGAGRSDLSLLEHPELLGDVFAWNKVYRRSFWDDAGLGWPEGVRYEDQPTTTRAFLQADGVHHAGRLARAQRLGPGDRLDRALGG